MNKHNRSIIGDRDALAARVAELEEKNDHLEGVISDKDALIAHYERQLAAFSTIFAWYARKGATA